MNGTPENQTFDFAQNASQPILTSQERRKMLQKSYRKKWLEKPESRELIRAIGRKASAKYRASRSLEEKAKEVAYIKKWHEAHREHVAELQRIRLSRPEVKQSLAKRMRIMRAEHPEYVAGELTRAREKRRNDPEYNRILNEKFAEWKRAHPEAALQQQRNFRRDNPHKIRAWKAIYSAVKSGEISKPTHCEHCGEEKYFHGHHSDYSKPLSVQWLCNACHKEAHWI